MTSRSTTCLAVPTLPTVFHADGTLDLDGQAALAATVAACGVDGVLVVDPVAGEGVDLADDDLAPVVTAVRRAAGGVPVLAGIGAPDATALGRARRLLAAGIDGLVVDVPAHGRTDALEDVASLGAPVALHHRAGAATPADVATLVSMVAEFAPSHVVVEVAPTADVVAAVVPVAAGPVLGGLGALFLPEELTAGADGTVAGPAVPEVLAEVRRAAVDGPEAVLDALLPALAYLRLELGTPGLRVRKEAWRQRGVIASARVRRGTPLAAATKQAVTRRLRSTGVGLTDPWPDA